MPSNRLHKISLVLFMTLGFCVAVCGAQSQPGEKPAHPVPEGGAAAAQRPVNRNIQQPPRQVVRPVQQPRQQGNQAARRPQQPVNQPNRQVGNQPQYQRGMRLGQQVGNQPQDQPRRPLGREQQYPRGGQPGFRAGNQPYPSMGGRTRTVQNLQFRGAGMGQVSKRPNGSVAFIHTNRMNIDRGLHGTRRIVAQRNGRTFVATGRHTGYVERPYLNRGGHMYVQRTYVVGGRNYAHVYRAYDYQGVRYCAYTPAYYYHPVFYGWASRGWGRPVHYSPAAWGWADAPWYTTYNVYFTPYPVYRAPAFWLTDFVLAASLQLAFQASVDSGQPPDGGAPEQYGPDGAVEETQNPMNPQVKEQITAEVQQQIAEEQQQAANQNPNQPPAPGGEEVPDALNSSQRVFIVSNDIDTSSQTGQECSLTGGDVVSRVTDQPDANQNVFASVMSSKQGDCATGQTVAVSVEDLQEMHNQFQQQVDAGLQNLAQNGGDTGLPQAPDAGTIAADIPPPTPDPGAANQLQVEQTQADQLESQVPAGSTM